MASVTMGVGRGRRNVARSAFVVAIVVAGLVLPAVPSAATPVCTDGYEGGAPRALCGGRVFPEAERSIAYVQYLPDPVTGFREYQHGMEYLAELYPRWVSVFNLRDRYGKLAVSPWEDRIRSYEKGDSGDGLDIWVLKITDHRVPDRDKIPLFFSLSVHGNERGGLEGGLRTAEDLAIAAKEGGMIVDGVANYDSTTGRTPRFHEYEVRDVLRREVIYLVDFNPDGWARGDLHKAPTSTYARGNSLGTDLNRQMPTIGRINPNRNPLEESEMLYGHRLMHEVADRGPNGLMGYAADVHGELHSNAYVDIMYPAGQFDSVDHRRLMAMAERTKSVIDETIYEGIIDEIEDATGGNQSDPPRTIPTKPAHWATVWDTLGYTDTGFIGDYMATDLAVTGMDYEIFVNHTVPDKVWNPYLTHNHINGTRAIIKTAMAYALYQEKEFNDSNVIIDPKGTAGYVFNPDTVTDDDANGPGRLPGPGGDGIGANGKPVEQRPYSVTSMRWFEDTSEFMPKPFVRMHPGTIAANGRTLNRLDTLVLADVPLPTDARGRNVDKRAYYDNIRAWVERGGNLVLTDRAVHALADLGIVEKKALRKILAYVPYADIVDLDHPMTRGLLPNARQLVDTMLLGYGRNDDEVWPKMTVVDEGAFEEAGGHVVGTTTEDEKGFVRSLERQLVKHSLVPRQTGVSVGEIELGKGRVRIIGGVLTRATEKNDHRYGLRDYAMTYTALYLMENSIVSDAPGLGSSRRAVERATDESGGTGDQRLGAVWRENVLASGGAALTAVLALAIAALLRPGWHPETQARPSRQQRKGRGTTW